MNFVALVVHGLSAMAVFGDLVFVRVLVGSLAVTMSAVLLAVVAIGVRLFTDLAIPGWATTVVGLATIVLVQSLTLSTAAAFMTLSNRSAFPFVPAVHARTFVKEIKRIWSK